MTIGKFEGVVKSAFFLFIVAIVSLTLTLTIGCGKQAKSDARDNTLSANADKKYGNRLKSEQSPYLLQHADNLVDWYPWGKEALDRAKKENKPIFLSIGYSTCHWCHVMAHESFEDSQTAELMNQKFVSIKVDREERPDLDNIYMQAVVAMTGSGGWPLSVFLTPEGKPFFGGTYFPPDNKYGRPGFKSLLTTVAEAWENKGEEILRTTSELENHLKQQALQSAPGEIKSEVLNSAYQTRLQVFDSTYGGFGNAPKFPMSHNLSFLLQYWYRHDQPQALQMVEQTLKKMAGGGIYDHVGGGFHRYSTDRFWLAPHFEKMLYDQAILSRTYLEAYQATGDQFYAQITREILDYILREMTDSQGGFYSAEDADSEGKEGTFYLWKPEEVKRILGEKDGELFCRIFDVTQAGNFEGENILHLEKPPAENLTGFISSCKEKLFQARKKRIHPHQDDKILTDWNGLMIGSLAHGYSVLGEPKYLAAAEKAADFILNNLQKDGRLLKHYRGKAAQVKGFLDDYAFFAYGLIELYQASFDPRWLKEAIRLTDDMLKLFGDEERAGFYFSAKDGEQLISRTKELYDGALPSGNSLAVYNLLRLGKLTMKQEYTDRAEAALKSFMGTVAQNPASHSQMLIALDFYLGPTQEIVIAGESDKEETRVMLENINRKFLPRKVVLLHPPGKAAQEIETLVPFLKGMNPKDGRATAYVCQNFACQLPTVDLAQLEQLLNQK